jgi:hypothetical protein
VEQEDLEVVEMVEAPLDQILQPEVLEQSILVVEEGALLVRVNHQKHMVVLEL